MCSLVLKDTHLRLLFHHISFFLSLYTARPSFEYYRQVFANVCQNLLSFPAYIIFLQELSTLVLLIQKILRGFIFAELRGREVS